MTANLVDYTEDNEYPVLGYSYFIVRMHTFTACDVSVELVRYMEWIMESGFARQEVTVST